MFTSSEWTTLYLVLWVWAGVVNSQNCAGIPHHNENTRESSKSQLMTTLLSIAAANGVLPDLLPVIQPALSNELPAEIPKTLNLIQLSNHDQRPQEPVVMTANPINTNQAPVGPHYNMPVLQTTFTPGLTQSTYTVPQALRVEGTPTGYPGVMAQPGQGTVQALPAVWQVQPTPNRAPERWQPIVHEMPPNLNLNPSPSLGNGNIEEPVSRLRFPLIDDNDGTPVNLQINLPPQNNPPPHITVVSAPSGQHTGQSGQNRHPPFLHPPIVVKQSDSLDHILPIILMLLATERDNCGCNCCCPCSSSKTIIPIPYPIPFPINNPIIDNCKSSSKHQNRDKTNDDDHEENE